MLQTQFKAYQLLDSIPALTYDNVKNYIENHTSYSVAFYDDNEDTLEDLNLLDFAKQVDGFIYSGSETKVILLCNQPKEGALLEILLHELGHVLDNNFNSESSSFARRQREEAKANLFASYVLNPNPFVYLLFRFWKNRYKIATVLSAIVFLIAGIIHIIA